MTDDKPKLRAPNPPIPAQVFPPPQRQTPVSQKEFRHEHEWGGTLDGKRICKGCGAVVS